MTADAVPECCSIQNKDLFSKVLDRRDRKIKTQVKRAREIIEIESNTSSFGKRRRWRWQCHDIQWRILACGVLRLSYVADSAIRRSPGPDNQQNAKQPSRQQKCASSLHFFSIEIWKQTDFKVRQTRLFLSPNKNRPTMQQSFQVFMPFLPIGAPLPHRLYNSN